MYSLASSLSVKLSFDTNAEQIIVRDGMATALRTNRSLFEADLILGSADYHFIENELLPPAYRTYSEKYWRRRTMAPSCLIYFVGLKKRVPRLQHHSLFFDVPFAPHAADIYNAPSWPREPLFYVSCTSKTDNSVCPPGHENLFILIPAAAGLEDNDDIRQHYFEMVMRRLEAQTGTSIEPHIDFMKSYAFSDFRSDYNAFKGNAYGLANTLPQTAILKPSIRSKRVKNLFYTGQLTVPGPGVPPSIISGEVVAREILKSLRVPDGHLQKMRNVYE
jgi:phytoene desaturase